tara:strand:- start:160 stop:1365 length:1206 start_codon:yes stop_codon:yes gene_type:complete
MTTKLRAASFQDGAVSTAKIAADAVTNAKIADDAVQTENVASTVNLGRRNLIINGAMQIAQRGTSASSKTTQGYHAVDRFDQNIATMGTYTISQSTTVPTGEGFVNSLKIDCTTADASPASGDVLSIRQRIEAQNLQHLDFGSSSSKAITLTFHVRSNKTGTYVCNAYLADAGKQWGKTYTISSADTWEKKTITWESSSNSSTINNDNGDGIILTWYLGTGSGRTTGSAQTDWTTYALADEAVGQTVNIADNTANEFYITGVQLEVGEQATPFEHRSYGEELQLCQRYFEIMFRGSNAQNGTQKTSIGAGVWYTANQVLVTLLYSPKRAQPTITQSETGALGFYGNSYFRTSTDSTPFDSITETGCRLNVESFNASGTAGDGAFGQLVNNNVSSVSIDAEL